MTPAIIEAADARIREMVESIYIDPTGKAEPIFDGVIDAQLYCASTPRIMWILKEPWDEGDSSGGGWSLCADVLGKNPVSSLSQATFHPIIYIAYGIFCRVSTFDDMPWVRDMDEPERVLRSLAFINAKKLPGVTRGAYAPSIMEWYSRGRAVIHEQISVFAPEIVFGCSPHMPAILDDLAIGWRERKQSAGSADYVWSDNILFVHVHHPGQTQINRARYVDDALMAVSLALSQKEENNSRLGNRP